MHEVGTVNQFEGTTIVSVRRDNIVAIGGDGQVSLGNTVMKNNAIKVRKIRDEIHRRRIRRRHRRCISRYSKRFESNLDKYQGQLTRSAVELAKDWRSDRALRRLEALLAVADFDISLIISGNGDVIET